VAWTEAYLHTKWHPNPSNRLATIHQRHRKDTTSQDRQDRQLSGSIGRTVLQTVAQKRTVQRSNRLESVTRMSRQRCLHVVANSPCRRLIVYVLIYSHDTCVCVHCWTAAWPRCLPCSSTLLSARHRHVLPVVPSRLNINITSLVDQHATDARHRAVPSTFNCIGALHRLPDTIVPVNTWPHAAMCQLPVSDIVGNSKRALLSGSSVFDRNQMTCFRLKD